MGILSGIVSDGSKNHYARREERIRELMKLSREALIDRLMGPGFPFRSAGVSRDYFKYRPKAGEPWSKRDLAFRIALGD